MQKHIRWGIATILLVSIISMIAVLGARSTNNPANNKLRVVTTYYPLYDFAVNVGGDKVSASNITPSGSEPHEYEPTPQQLVTATNSNVFIYNGGALEPWTDKFVKGYKHAAVKSSTNIPMLQGTNGGNSTLDPHFWLDPVLAQTMVNNIRDGLSKADPANSAYYNEHATAYNAKLAELDAAFKKGLATCQLRTVVTSHAAFSYLAKRYNLEVLSIAGMSPEEEPSAAKLAELANTVKDKGVKYIFFESLVSPKMTQTIADETGAKALVFDTIEGVSDEDQKLGKDYISIQRTNLENLRTALACN